MEWWTRESAIGEIKYGKDDIARKKNPVGPQPE